MSAFQPSGTIFSFTSKIVFYKIELRKTFFFYMTRHHTYLINFWQKDIMKRFANGTVGIFFLLAGSRMVTWDSTRFANVHVRIVILPPDLRMVMWEFLFKWAVGQLRICRSHAKRVGMHIWAGFVDTWFVVFHRVFCCSWVWSSLNKCVTAW